jgi:hypothetical protein
MTTCPTCDVNDHNPDGIRKPCNCGIELKTSYYRQAVKNLADAASKANKEVLL